MTKYFSALFLLACALPFRAHATTTSGYDSLVSELPIAVQGVAVLDLAQGHATVDGSLTVDGALTTHGYVGINTLNPTDALDVVGNAVFTGNVSTSGQLMSKGDISIGQDSTYCQGSTAGTMRFDASSHLMQFCDGGSWQSASGGEPGSLCGMIVTNAAHPGFPIWWASYPPMIDIACQGHNDGSCPAGYTIAQVSLIPYGAYGDLPVYSCIKN